MVKEIINMSKNYRKVVLPVILWKSRWEEKRRDWGMRWLESRGAVYHRHLITFIIKPTWRLSSEWLEYLAPPDFMDRHTIEWGGTHSQKWHIRHWDHRYSDTGQIFKADPGYHNDKKQTARFTFFDENKKEQIWWEVFQPTMVVSVVPAVYVDDNRTGGCAPQVAGWRWSTHQYGVPSDVRPSRRLFWCCTGWWFPRL